MRCGRPEVELPPVLGGIDERLKVDPGCKCVQEMSKEKCVYATSICEVLLGAEVIGRIS